MLTKTTFALAIIIAAASGALADTKKPGHGSGGFSTGPYHQGTPNDNLPIWRWGYYQGNDPDQHIRLQLMRDGRNYAH